MSANWYDDRREVARLYRWLDARYDPAVHGIEAQVKFIEHPELFADEYAAMCGEQVASPSESMTDEQREAQRRSFAYGNTRLDNDDITREMIDRAAIELEKRK